MPHYNLNYPIPILSFRMAITGQEVQLGEWFFVNSLPPAHEWDHSKLYIQWLPRDERDAIFGMMIELWDLVEGRIEELFSILLQADRVTSQTIFTSYNGLKPISDVIEGLAEDCLDGDITTALEKLLRRVRSHATKRNRLIHGKWQMVVDFETQKIAGQDAFVQCGGHWERVYFPTSPSERGDLGMDVAPQFKFTMDQILEFSQSVQNLTGDINRFLAESIYPRLPDPPAARPAPSHD